MAAPPKNAPLEEKARWLFAQPCTFFAAAHAINQLPASNVPEVVFAGRSNVGKSSLLNALTSQKNLARISRTPGRTQQLNFFSLIGKLTIVDMPGYGYAKVSKQKKMSWSKVMHYYLQERSQIKRVYILIDGRHGLKPVDYDLMEELDHYAVSYQIVLTKIDKSSASTIKSIEDSLLQDYKQHPAMVATVIKTSAKDKIGLKELRNDLSTFLVDNE